jgi:hypothetical protein
MKYLVIILLISVTCCLKGAVSQKNCFAKRTMDLQASNSSKPDSDFDLFITQFCFNPDFQKQRIKFPLKYDNLDSETTIDSEDWIIDRIYANLESFTIVSNELKINKNPNERVFTWINTASEISKNYYFKKWLFRSDRATY